MFRATPPIIRSSKTVIAASGFTCISDCRLLQWLSHHSDRQPKTHVKPEAAITVFELHLVGSFYEIYITMHGSMNIKFNEFKLY